MDSYSAKKASVHLWGWFAALLGGVGAVCVGAGVVGMVGAGLLGGAGAVCVGVGVVGMAGAVCMGRLARWWGSFLPRRLARVRFFLLRAV